MARESLQGAGRDTGGPHAFTIQIEKLLRDHPEGMTLDEITAVAIDRKWVSRGYAHRSYARHLNSSRKIGLSTDGPQSINEPWSPERVMLEGKTTKAIRFVLQKVIFDGCKPGRWCQRREGKYYATGKGIRTKYRGGFTEEQIHATPEQISRDVIERELIRALKPHMHQKTHKLTPGEWELLSKWVQLSVVGWQP